MKKHLRLPLLVTAALFALTACAPAADTTPAASAAESSADSSATSEVTAEPTAEPAAAETGPLYGMNNSSYAQSVVYDVMPAFNDQFDYIGTNVYKNDLNAGQVSLFYSCDDWCSAEPYVTSDAVYLLTYNRDRDNKIIALSHDGTKTHEIPFDPYASAIVLYRDHYFYCLEGCAPMTQQAGSALTCRPARQRPGTCPPKQPPCRTLPVILP